MKYLCSLLLITGCVHDSAQDASGPRGHMSQADDPSGRRVTHPQEDLTCQDETPTGTSITRRKCRSNSEKAQDKKTVEDLYLNPSSRPGAR